MDALSTEAAQRELATLKNWTLDGAAIRKSFRFSNYGAVIHFVNQVARIADRLNHHPDLLVKYGSAEVTFTTHDAGGLTAADFEAARAVDAV